MDHHIHLPTTVQYVATDRKNIEQVVVTPCSQGYGTTLGNAFRRVLLSSLPGAAVEAVKIAGVQHEFSAVDGVQEDMIEIILNLKQLAVRVHSAEPVTLTLQKKGKGPITAKDFDKNADVDIANDDMVIATLTDDKKEFNMEIIVAQGQGYVPVAQRNTKHLDLGTIAIDALYTPIRDVGYTVEMTRVGDVTNFEKLILTVETDGTITPKEAIEQATSILMDHLVLLMGGTEDDTEEVKT
ncbi:MAG: DNA-directed RNA polymerase subunit alpha [Candidatus Magasanikbacteria bacterium CG11_big_fil_rev_8_21_14_0_20_43_7]|uniref:DNA-directed RNA polymerase subunit alpha n=1 Tax=Candidatus Magasanikbacteria bacterium CG11_big_fil_rev_8_21_14_0_20_43_7 TaxID=1974654 RepID=A0A2H0N5U2_9BACT|nr:MAG: DNA-directed RNA polymerase subunit alpha [Candidatus Magasanikbacteria bacterium CG11_big_fil_rev_8_21_14_0_20_43_7]